MLENLSYALVQVVHNFGAAAVTGGAVWGLHPALGPAFQRRLVWVIGLSWGAQALSGAGFGTVSYYYYGQFPELSGVAFAALLTKILCAMGGVVVSVAYLRRADGWSEARRHAAWKLLTGLGTTALAAAAFLRWYA
ncbi:hypothetical protein [Nitrosovibrio sp. Nv17]|uniref:hypothetical protein n=1 Tax=Nitrosovibrio sp. Nv17 TaxID=1855339 RepID=UPI000908F38F|nr:hypothetical protein [Nitrosovibrio sp. Nv17]SFW14056.1 hypothetical protein SAMN05216414_102114 [Nitrosovibrio sp. Nv17]